LYLKFFGLTEAPFAITPDPAFVYLSPEHRDALAHLSYGVGQGGSGGFVQLTGEVGTGKTTMCRCLLEQLPEDTHVALVLNPLLTPRELLATICEELGIDTASLADSNKAMVDALNRYLLQQHARGHRVVVVIDEAQNLSPDSLEQVRLLTNLETPKEKLLQMVLLGQPELRQLLQRSDLRQLAQRVTARYHLKPLSREETRAYVRHRMMVAGAQRSPFTRSALRVLYQRSDGVPRLINIIADRALAAAYARESGRVNGRLVQAAANEVQPSEERMRSNPWPGIAATAAALALVGITLVNWGPAWLERNGSDNGMPAPVSDAGPALEQDPESRTPGTVSADDVANDIGQPAAGVNPETVIPATPAREADTADSLDAGWVDIQHLGAWRSLAGLWGDPVGAATLQSACDGVPGLGYACLADSGSLSRIRHLGLPVLLVLRGGGYRLLPLRGFDGDKVIAGAPEDSRRISRSDLEEIWLGEYLLAWPQAPDWPLEIRRGESGPAVDIVLQMAAYAKPAWQGGGMFDASFESWLMDFQRRNGLDADGIIGPNTLIHLMAPTLGEPRLVMNPKEDG
jgi:general secretion pathway protein A